MTEWRSSTAWWVERDWPLAPAQPHSRACEAGCKRRPCGPAAHALPPAPPQLDDTLGAIQAEQDYQRKLLLLPVGALPGKPVGKLVVSGLAASARPCSRRRDAERNGRGPPSVFHQPLSSSVPLPAFPPQNTPAYNCTDPQVDTACSAGAISQLGATAGSWRCCAGGGLCV